MADNNQDPIGDFFKKLLGAGKPQTEPPSLRKLFNEFMGSMGNFEVLINLIEDEDGNPIDLNSSEGLEKLTQAAMGMLENTIGKDALAANLRQSIRMYEEILAKLEGTASPSDNSNKISVRRIGTPRPTDETDYMECSYKPSSALLAASFVRDALAGAIFSYYGADVTLIDIAADSTISVAIKYEDPVQFDDLANEVASMIEGWISKSYPTLTPSLADIDDMVANVSSPTVPQDYVEPDWLIESSIETVFSTTGQKVELEVTYDQSQNVDVYSTLRNILGEINPAEVVSTQRTLSAPGAKLVLQRNGSTRPKILKILVDHDPRLKFNFSETTQRLISQIQMH